MTSDYIIIIFLLLLITIIIDKPLYHKVFAASPAFNRQEITDEAHDGIYLNRMGQSETKHDYIGTLDESTDIQKVTYFSNGTVLIATLWLASGFEEKPSANGSNVAVSYGILIDADYNQETGKEGVDYQIEILCSSNETQTCIKGIIEYSSPVHNRTIDIQENYTGFYKNDEKYVLLSVNLDEILSPNPYKAMFYAGYVYNNSDRKIDLSTWVDISPPVYSISTLPNPVIVRQGEQKIIGAQLKSTTGFVQNVIEFMPVENYSSVELEFIRDNLNKSSSGIEPAPFRIDVPKNAQVGQYVIPIRANISTGSTFPYYKFITFSNVNLPSNSTDILTKGHKIESANLTISVVEPLSVQEQLRDFYKFNWSRIGWRTNNIFD
jgi:hypothetical protein